jgi:ribonucleotide monophosphatase NagD (HAD superfamily)
MGIDFSAEQKQGSDKESTGIVMIGDDVEHDLGGGAAELGLIRYLVQTGKYRAKDEDRDAYGGVDGTFEDFGAVVDHILSSKQQP